MQFLVHGVGCFFHGFRLQLAKLARFPDVPVRLPVTCHLPDDLDLLYLLQATHYPVDEMR